MPYERTGTQAGKCATTFKASLSILGCTYLITLANTIKVIKASINLFI